MKTKLFIVALLMLVAGVILSQSVTSLQVVQTNTVVTSTMQVAVTNVQTQTGVYIDLVHGRAFFLAVNGTNITDQKVITKVCGTSYTNMMLEAGLTQNALNTLAQTYGPNAKPSGFGELLSAEH